MSAVEEHTTETLASLVPTVRAITRCRGSLNARQLLSWSAWLTSLLALAYLLDSDSFAPPFRDKYLLHRTLVTVHGISGLLALSVGPFLIFGHPEKLRFHRRLGLLYLLAVLVGGVSGFQLAKIAFGGAIAQAGFSVLALGWFASAIAAYRYARARRIEEHRRWMAHNYALTFSAVSLRVMIHSAEILGLSLGEVYPWAAWLCWLVNLAVLETSRRIVSRER